METKTMTLDEAMTEVRACGWGGVCVWAFTNRVTGQTRYMACLTNAGDPDFATNLWDYTDTAEEALIGLVKKAHQIIP